MQAQWSTRGLENYRYDFGQGGFFNACPRPVRVFVRAGVVDSAILIATNEKLSLVGYMQSCVPTIDDLFSDAASAAQAGTLTKITIDPQYGYPTMIQIAGPPDASGYLTASALQPE